MSFRFPKMLPEATFDLPEIGPKASLRGRIATDANKPYFNALLKVGGKRIQALARARMTTEALERNRTEDAALYPKFVITGWTGIIDDDTSKEVEFSPERCEKFFAQLVVDAPWIFDRVRNFFAAPENFLKEEETPPDPAAVAGN